MSRPPFPRPLAIAAVVLALPALAGCVAIPKLDEALAESETIAQTTKVYAADGSLITELHAEENREVIPLAEVPHHVRNAVIAIEDARFYDHAGVDYLAVARAFSRNVSEGQIREGGSTITQQLVKNTLIGREKTFKRKIREAVLAYQFEQRFTKDEILERYLNTVYFGRGAYGVQAAAQAFFSKDARDLTVAQGAMLAGLIRSPSRYDPESDPDGARARRNQVLDRMRDEDMLTDREFDAAARKALGLKPKPEEDKYPFAYFVDYLKDYIFDGDEQFRKLGVTRAERINSLFKGGLRIYTTLDPKLQKTAERAARKTLPYKSDPYTAFVGMRPDDGAVVAMVGGRDFWNPKDKYAKFNLATDSRRQPGSSFKPFTLVAALERGIPLSRVYRAPSRITLRLPNGTFWSPRNYEGNSYGSMTLKKATALSVNSVYAQVVLEVGAKNVVEVGHRMGLQSRLDPFPSIALGTQEVSPLDLAAGYSTLANGGYRVPPTPLLKITDAAGTVVWQWQPKKKKVLGDPIVANAIDALQEVMRAGTGRRLQLGRAAAGKTGTSEEYRDAWFAGFTRQFVGVSWVGFPRAQIAMRPPRTRIRVFGSSWPGQMWRQFMLQAHEGLPEEKFPEAKEESLLVKVKVDTSRGCLPNEFTPPYLIKEQQYVSGSEPKEVCTEPTTGEIPSTPFVIGMPATEGRRALERAGFAVGSSARYCPAFTPGTVCDQTPDPGSEGEVGDRATIFVSNDAAIAQVPIVLGRTLDRAKQKLQEYGYKVKVIEAENTAGFEGCRVSSETEEGRVWLQNPCGGADYGKGSTVTIYVNP